MAFRRVIVVSGGQVIEDIVHYSRVQRMINYASSNDRCDDDAVDSVQGESGDPDTGSVIYNDQNTTV